MKKNINMFSVWRSFFLSLSLSLFLITLAGGRVDLNEDYRIDITELKILAQQWLASEGSANFNGQNGIDMDDFDMLSKCWLSREIPLLINEFMASNSSSLPDENGDYPDWIEVYNPTALLVDLTGWRLTDDKDDLAGWPFPSITLDPFEYLIVYASGKDRRDPAGELHTDFKLNADGEYLALIDAAGAFYIAHEYDPEFPAQTANVSYGISNNIMLYMVDVSPGESNNDGYLGLVEDTKFNVDRRFYDNPFDLEITTATEGATVYYTTDGTEPDSDNPAAKILSGSININQTSTVRAVAIKDGYLPTNIDTHTYIFVDDVVAQDYQKTIDLGLPSSWGGVSPDYGMDSKVIGPNDNYGGLYAATIKDDLKVIPSMSIVLDVDDMFGDNGIYTQSTQHGLNWERAASAELIYPNGEDGFQIDCGIRIQGGWFRSHNGTRKHSFRLLFKEIYGPTKLEYDLFKQETAVKSFDTITLRAGANDGYSWNAAQYTEQYIRDEFGRSLQIATGNSGSHGMKQWSER